MGCPSMDVVLLFSLGGLAGLLAGFGSFDFDLWGSDGWGRSAGFGGPGWGPRPVAATAQLFWFLYI